MKRALTTVILVIACTTTGGFAHAGPNPFSDCGIGAALFEKTRWAAVTSNVIWDLGVTAVVSATASPETCIDRQQAETAIIIMETLPELEREIALGGGRHIDLISSNLRCRNGLADAISTAYEPVIVGAGYMSMSRVDKSLVIYNAVRAHSSAVCEIVL